MDIFKESNLKESRILEWHLKFHKRNRKDTKNLHKKARSRLKHNLYREKDDYNE